MNRRTGLFVVLVLLLLGVGAAVLLLSQPPTPDTMPTLAATATSEATPSADPVETTPETTPAAAAADSTIRDLAAEPGNTTVTLTWSPVAGAAGYNVYRDGAEQPLNPTLLTEPMFQDIGLTNRRTYTYRVAAVLPDGSVAPLSDPVDAVPQS